MPRSFSLPEISRARHYFVLAVLLALSVSAPTRGNLVISSTPGTTHEADGYSSFTTSSAEMIGMEVSVSFRNGSTETATWTATGINTVNWSITQGPGSTFSNPFTLTNSGRLRMTGLRMHGGGSSVIFDRSTAASTDGTANGKDLQEVSTLSQSQDIFVNYFDQVQTTGASPVGDIFAGIDIVFQTGIRRNRQFVFITDTDNTINFVEPIPEPATFIKTGILFAGILARRRKRTR